MQRAQFGQGEGGVVEQRLREPAQCRGARGQRIGQGLAAGGRELVADLGRQQAAPALGVAQRLRQRRQGNLAAAALVVIGREIDQVEPVAGQRRQFGADRGDLAQAILGHLGVSGDFADKPHHQPLAERHQRQHADARRQRAAIAVIE